MSLLKIRTMNNELIQEHDIEFLKNDTDQENTTIITEILNNFEIQFDVFLNQKVDDVLYCIVDEFLGDYNDFVTEYSRFVGDFRNNTFLSLKLDGLREKVNKLSDKMGLYYNAGNVVNDNDDSVNRNSHNTMDTTIIPIPASTSTIVTKTTSAKKGVTESNLEQKKREPQIELANFSTDVDKHLTDFTLQLSTIRLIHDFLDFCSCISPDHELYTDLLIIKEKIKVLINLMIKTASETKDCIQAGHVLDLLSGYIQGCVGKTLDNDMVENLWDCFNIIQNLVDKWYVDIFDIAQVIRNLESIEKEKLVLNQKSITEYNTEQANELESFSRGIQMRIDGFIGINDDILEFIENYFGFRKSCYDFSKGTKCGYVSCKFLVVDERMQTLINLVITDVEREVVSKEDAHIKMAMLESHIENCVGKDIPCKLSHYLEIFFTIIQILSKRWGFYFDEAAIKRSLQRIQNEQQIDEYVRKIKWYINKFEDVNTTDLIQLCEDYFEFVETLPKDSRLDQLQEIALSMMGVWLFICIIYEKN